MLNAASGLVQQRMNYACMQGHAIASCLLPSVLASPGHSPPLETTRRAMASTGVPPTNVPPRHTVCAVAAASHLSVSSAVRMPRWDWS